MTTEEKDRIEKDTEKYFGSGPRVRYETRAGEGSGALILRFKEMEPGKNTLKRRFVIKRALEHDFDGDIENEINWLNVSAPPFHLKPRAASLTASSPGELKPPWQWKGVSRLKFGIGLEKKGPTKSGTCH